MKPETALSEIDRRAGLLDKSETQAPPASAIASALARW